MLLSTMYFSNQCIALCALIRTNWIGPNVLSCVEGLRLVSGYR